MIEILAGSDYVASENTLARTLSLSDFAPQERLQARGAWINTGGWQSWSPGFEVAPGKKQPSLGSVVKGWNNYLVFPQSHFRPSKNLVLCQFVCYLRQDDFYLVIASVGNAGEKALPPVQFVLDREQNTVTVELCDKGTEWKAGDVQAQIEIFSAESYFECKDILARIFPKSHFERIAALGKNPGGWESWYNHYAKIDERLILGDLDALGRTRNIISKGNYSAKVFQIDDGWEKGLGNWEIDDSRFPAGLAPVAGKIEAAGHIPGLWIAPFIMDLRSPAAQSHPDWLLRDRNGHLIPAGYNPLWGSNGIFYCLDLSRDDVLAFADGVIERAIYEWGFRYLKLDFLYAGMIHGNYAGGGAGWQWYDRAVRQLTSRAQGADGKPVFYLGCGAPFELSFRYFPLSRIGCDTLEHWENRLLKLINWNGRNSAYLNIKDTLGHAMWDKVIFANDPDVLFIRNDNCSLTRNQKILISTVDSIFGSQLMYSDDPATSCSDEETALAEEMLCIMEKYKDEEFGVQNITEDVYKIFTRSKKFTGEISLKKNDSYIRIEEN